MRRIGQHRERGATAVVAAIVLLVVVGFTALAVDMGALWWDKKQLQNGADAGALAIAQSCAESGPGGECVVGTNPTAQHFAEANKSDASATGWVENLTASSVTVDTESTRDLWFANVLGTSDSVVSASATASWGAPNKMTTLPLAFSLCWFQYQTGSTTAAPPPTTETYYVPLKSKSGSIADGTLSCGTHAAHAETAGGFGWTSPDLGGGCGVTIDLDDPWIKVSTGQPAPCDVGADLSLGSVALVPLFDEWRGQGANAEYKIYAFAAVEVKSYCFGPHAASAGATLWPKCQNLPVMSEDKGPNLGVRFVTYVSLEDALELGGPNLGVTNVRLTG